MQDYSALLGELDNLPASKTNQSMYALLVVYIPRLDEINLEYGYHLGEQVLQRVSQCISQLLKPHDLHAKIGNQEVAILLREIDSPGQAIMAAQNIHEELSMALQFDEQGLKVKINIGITYYPHHSRNGSELIRQSGIAARTANNNRVNYCVYSSDAIARGSSITLESSLETAIDNAEIRAYYQPIRDLATNQVVSFESLARWQSAQFGHIPPETFIDIAEKSALIRKLTILTLNTTLREFHSLSRLFPESRVSVNLSAALLNHEDLVEIIERALNIWDVRPEMLSLEITESAIMEDRAISGNILGQLNDLGINLAIDDFGMGQASLKYIKYLPVTEVKIDKSFISKIDTDEADRKIVGSIIDLAHKLNLIVVAEGIENAACLEILKSMNCQRGQGFYFARPAPVEKLTATLKSS